MERMAHRRRRAAVSEAWRRSTTLALCCNLRDTDLYISWLSACCNPGDHRSGGGSLEEQEGLLQMRRSSDGEHGAGRPPLTQQSRPWSSSVPTARAAGCPQWSR